MRILDLIQISYLVSQSSTHDPLATTDGQGEVIPNGSDCMILCWCNLTNCNYIILVDTDTAQYHTQQIRALLMIGANDAASIQRTQRSVVGDALALSIGFKQDLNMFLLRFQ